MLPAPGALSTSIRPPWAWAMASAVGRPRPTPSRGPPRSRPTDEEALEQAALIGLGDPGTRIAHGQARPSVVALDADVDPAAVGREADGVRQEVHEGALEAAMVAEDRQRPVRRLEDDRRRRDCAASGSSEAMPSAAMATASNRRNWRAMLPVRKRARSRMSPTRRCIRSALRSIVSTSVRCCSGVGSLSSASSRPAQVRIAVSGVRSSWAMVADRSVRSVSSSRRRVSSSAVIEPVAADLAPERGRRVSMAGAPARGDADEPEGGGVVEGVLDDGWLRDEPEPGQSLVDVGRRCRRRRGRRGRSERSATAGRSAVTPSG